MITTNINLTNEKALEWMIVHFEREVEGRTARGPTTEELLERAACLRDFEKYGFTVSDEETHQILKYKFIQHICEQELDRLGE